MKLWKCYNCEPALGVDFFDEAGTCPTCELSASDPRHGRRIVQCRIIHFDPPHPSVNGVGCGHLACDPTKKIGQISAMASGVLDVVNCPDCRATDDWKAAKAKIGEGPDVVKGGKAGLASEVLA